MPKISIIVPVYKTEQYLDRCVSSILAQTLQDFELILVDDGSPDSCPAICDAYAKEDPRIRVIHKKNGGVSSARNAGLEIAVGDYIAFVDSDDYIEPDMYEKMLEKAHTYGCDIVMCDCLKEFSKSSQLYTHNIRPGYYSDAQLVSEYYPNLLMMANVEYPPTISNCTLLWKSTLNTTKQRYISGVRFSEDLLFGAMLMRKASSFYYMKGEPFYHYVMNDSSATHVFTPDKWLDYQKLHQHIVHNFSDDYKFDFHHQIDLCLLFFLYNAVGALYSAPLEQCEKKNMILAILNDAEVRAMFGRLEIQSLPISRKQKIITMCYRHRVGISALMRYYGD